MLQIIRSLKELNFRQFMDVYTESNRENGNQFYPMWSQTEQVIQAEQDFYAYLREFLHEEGTFCAVWTVENHYVAALRIEPYRDGFLIAGLETLPDERGRGYAQALLSETISYIRMHEGVPIYSHIDKQNRASLAVHLSCGFQRMLEYAVYTDGSVLQNACTMCLNS